jgi:hypothetical protein
MHIEGAPMHETCPRPWTPVVLPRGGEPDTRARPFLAAVDERAP